MSKRQKPDHDFSPFRIAFDHLTAKQSLDQKQVATLAVMFFVGIIRRDEGDDAAKAVIMTALDYLGPPFVPTPRKPK